MEGDQPPNRPALKVEDALTYLDRVRAGAAWGWRCAVAQAPPLPRVRWLWRAHTRLVWWSPRFLRCRCARLQVKNVFAADTEVYDRFLDIMKNFKAQT